MSDSSFNWTGATLMKLSDIAAKLDCRLDSASAASANTEITGVAGIEDAQQGQITFFANKRYYPLLKTTKAAAVFVDDNVTVSRDPSTAPLALLRSANPYLAF